MMDDSEALKIRSKCRYFRVLIMGKANAGKTTILQKMCNTSEKPIVKDSWGRIISSASMGEVSQGRGVHNIHNEVTYESNPAFVFHDSGGFESGTTNELEVVREFILERSKRRKLQEQLHVIWFCLPCDNDRPLCEAEMIFFAFGTGNVPVIPIFTKFDGLITKSMSVLQQEGLPMMQARRAALERAQILFQENYLERLKATQYPPASHVCLRNMHKANTDCRILTQETAKALSDPALKLLFVSVQQNNIELCIEEAIKGVIERSSPLKFAQFTKDAKTNVVTRVAAWFPQYWLDERFSFREFLEEFRELLELDEFESSFFFFEFEFGIPSSSLLCEPAPAALQVLTICAAAAIALEYSFWRRCRFPEAVTAYKASREIAVFNAVNDVFLGEVEPLGILGGFRILGKRETSEKLLRVVLANLLHS